MGEIEFELPPGRIYNRDKSKRPQRKKRIVRQEIKVSTVKLCPPPRKGRKLSPVSINIIHCAEIDPPNQEDKIEWFLLTSFPIKDVETAIDIVGWYLCRWQIEIFFKILKSGCSVEKLQFENFKAISNCIALYMIVAWRIMIFTRFCGVIVKQHFLIQSIAQIQPESNTLMSNDDVHGYKKFL